MKLKNKLAMEYVQYDKYRVLSPQVQSLTLNAYLAGFEKARELCSEIVMEVKISDFFEVGEKEVR